MRLCSSTRTSISRFVTLFLVVACVVVIRAQEPTLPIIWSSQLPWCCEKIVANPDDEYVYYKYKNFIGKVRASDGMFLDSVLVPDDSVINMDYTYGLFHLRTRSQLIAVGDGIPRYDDKLRGMIQIYDVPDMRHNRSILIPMWREESNQGYITGPNCISADENYIAISGRYFGSSSRIYVYDLLSGELVWMHVGGSDEFLSAAFTRDSNRLVIVRRSLVQNHCYLSCWDFEQNTMLWEKAVTPKIGTTYQFSANGQRIVVNNQDLLHLGVYTYPEFTPLYQSDSIVGDHIPNDDGTQILMRTGLKSGLKILNVETGARQPVDPTNWSFAALHGWDQLYFGTSPGYGRMYKVRFDWSVGVYENPDAEWQSLSPNPCNTETQLSFFQRAPQRVLVTVHDSSGRLLSREFDGFLEAGSHPVSINCSALPDGVCFVRVTMGAEITTHPLMVQKGGVVK